LHHATTEAVHPSSGPDRTRPASAQAWLTNGPEGRDNSGQHTHGAVTTAGSTAVALVESRRLDLAISGDRSHSHSRRGRSNCPATAGGRSAGQPKCVMLARRHRL